MTRVRSPTRSDRARARSFWIASVVLLVAVARCSRRREHQDFDAAMLLAVPEALRRGQWRELLSGRTLQLHGEHFRAADLFSDLPAAVLTADAASTA